MPRNDLRPILVTGAHRSGTTWVGKMLALAPDVYFLGEVFNLDLAALAPPSAHAYCLSGLRYWYQYVDAGNQALFRDELERLLHLRYPRAAKWAQAHNWREHGRVLKANAGMIVRRSLGRRRALLKDPIALMAAPWLHVEFNVQPVVLIRHPAAMVASLKRLGWYATFNSFTSQPELMQTRLRQFAVELQTPPPQSDLIGQAILMWRLLYTVVEQYQREWPGWLYVHHERLSQQPVQGFQQIYDYLGLCWTPAIEKQISAYSDRTNPQASSGRLVRQLRLDSAANTKCWQKILSPAEVERVRIETAGLYDCFYGDDDWGPAA